MKVLLVALVSAFLAFLIVQIYSFRRQGVAAEESLEALRAQLVKAEEERARLEGDLEYYGNPANLEKELRSKFNYRRPDERIIVIVPPPASATTSTAP